MFYFNRHEFLKTGKPKKIRRNIINNQFILIGVIRDESSYLIVVFLKFPMYEYHHLNWDGDQQIVYVDLHRSQVTCHLVDMQRFSWYLN